MAEIGYRTIEDVFEDGQMLNDLLFAAAEIYGYPEDEDGDIFVDNTGALIERILEDIANYTDLRNS